MAKQALRPLPGYVLIKDKEISNKISGHFAVVDSGNKQQPSVGNVISCGHSVVDEKGKLINCPVEDGNQVIYKKYFDGGIITLEGEEYKIVPFKDLIGTLEEE